jgi:hypothetical protein
MGRGDIIKKLIRDFNTQNAEIWNKQPVSLDHKEVLQRLIYGNHLIAQ